MYCIILSSEPKSCAKRDRIAKSVLGVASPARPDPETFANVLLEAGSDDGRVKRPPRASVAGSRARGWLRTTWSTFSLIHRHANRGSARSASKQFIRPRSIRTNHEPVGPIEILEDNSIPRARAVI